LLQHGGSLPKTQIISYFFIF